MKALLYTVALVFLATCCFGQKVPQVYQIRADSVHIYSTCDTAELVLENRTKDTLGFLFNKGKGRTEFRRLGLERIGASQLAIKGQDTVDLNFSSYGDTRYDQLLTNFYTIAPGDSMTFFQWPTRKVIGYDAYDSPDMPVLSNQAIQSRGSKLYYNGLVVSDGSSGFDLAVNWDGELNGPNGAFLRTRDDTKQAWSKWRELLFKDYADTAYAPRNASGSYIQNQTAADQPSSGFRITGIGRSNSQFQVVKDGSESLSPALQLVNAAATRGANMQLDGNANPGLSFWQHDGTAWKRNMTLTANGKLGLGTANPLFGMHITGKPACLILETTSPYSGGSGGFIEAFNRGVPTAANQRLGGMAMGAMPDSLSLAPAIVIDALSEAAWTNNVSHPTYLRILTTPANSVQPLERMRITAAGNVGIGITNPTVPLHVNGAAAVGALNGLGNAPLQVTSGSSAQVINLMGGGTAAQSNQGGAISLFGGVHATQPGMITFYTGTGVGGTQQPERMRITAAGNVGIGTASPTTKLEVAGNIRATNGRVQATDGTITMDMYYAAGAGTIGTLSNNPVVIVSGGVEQARLTSNGLEVANTIASGAIITNGAVTLDQNGGVSGTTLNVTDAVGIGVSTPVHSLDVQGSVGFSSRTVTATTTLTSTDYIIQVNNTAAATINLPTSASANKRVYIIKKISGGSLNVTVDPAGSEMIDNGTTKILTLQYSSIMIYANGTGWSIIGAYAPGMTL